MALSLLWHFARFGCAIPLKSPFPARRFLPIEFANSLTVLGRLLCIVTSHGTWPKRKDSGRRLCFSCLQIAAVYFIFCWRDWKLVCNGGCSNTACELVPPMLQIHTVRACVLTQPQSSACGKSRSLVLIVFTSMFIPWLCSLWKLMHISGSGVV